MERGGAGRPVARALLAADRAPREGRARQARAAGRVPRLRQGRVPPAQRVRGRLRSGVGEHRQHERLGVPEAVAVVAGPGQALRRDRPPLGPGTGLQHVEQREPHGLLELGVALDLDVGALPELVQVRPLLRDQPVPAGVRAHRRAPRRPGRARRAASGRRPAIGDELDQPQALARLAASPTTITRPRCGKLSACTSVSAGPSTSWSMTAAIRSLLRLVECTSPARRSGAASASQTKGASSTAATRGSSRRGGQRLVGDQLGLDDDPGRPSIASTS